MTEWVSDGSQGGLAHAWRGAVYRETDLSDGKSGLRKDEWHVLRGGSKGVFSPCLNCGGRRPQQHAGLAGNTPEPHVEHPMSPLGRLEAVLGCFKWPQPAVLKQQEWNFPALKALNPKSWRLPS